MSETVRVKTNKSHQVTLSKIRHIPKQDGFRYTLSTAGAMSAKRFTNVGVIGMAGLNSSTNQSQQILPELQISSMRQRVSKAYNLYNDNLKLYDRLSNTKSTLPKLEKMIRKQNDHDKLLKRISHYETKYTADGLEKSTAVKTDPMVKLERQRVNMKYL